MEGIGKELMAFIQAVVSGMLIHFVYYILTVLRTMVKHRFYVIQIEDFLFWVATSFYLFHQIYRTGSGRIRLYFVAGVVCGMLLFSFLDFLIKRIWPGTHKGIDKTEQTD